MSIGVLSRIGADAALNLEKIVGSRKCVACFKIEDGITKYVYICGSDSVGTKKNGNDTNWTTVARVERLSRRQVIRSPCTREKWLLRVKKNMIFHFHRKQSRGICIHMNMQGICRLDVGRTCAQYFFGMLPIG